MTEPLLHLRAVNKRFNPGTAHEVHAVRDFDLRVERAEIVALLGSSGCGKTSTLRMIAGFEEVSEGAIVLAGREIHALAPAKRKIAMAFEGYSLYPPLTVRENIGFGLGSRRISRAEVARRVAEVAHLLDLDSILDRYPSSISGGQQQRASLGRALVRETDLHLLDEPMGQLEPQLRALLRGRIKHFIKERGLTVILVTHDQTEANALADRIAVMEDGMLQQLDTPEQLRDRPANLFTGAFIGEPPMNLFEATVGGAGGAVTFALGDGVELRFPEDAFSPALRERLGAVAAVTVGVRPHAVHVAAEGRRAEVVANQWLGDQTHVAARFAGGIVVSVMHERIDCAPGDAVGVSVAADDLHIFDTATGRALSHGGTLA